MFAPLPPLSLAPLLLPPAPPPPPALPPPETLPPSPTTLYSDLQGLCSRCVSAFSARHLSCFATKAANAAPVRLPPLAHAANLDSGHRTIVPLVAAAAPVLSPMLVAPLRDAAPTRTSGPFDALREATAAVALETASASLHRRQPSRHVNGIPDPGGPHCPAQLPRGWQQLESGKPLLERTVTQPPSTLITALVAPPPTTLCLIGAATPVVATVVICCNLRPDASRGATKSGLPTSE